MKKYLFALLLTIPASMWGKISVIGTDFVEITPAKSTGLDAVYVLRDASAATLTYESSGSDVVIERYSKLGGGFAEPIGNVTTEGNLYSWKPDTEGMGYIVNDSSSRECIWIVNYSSAPFGITALTADESECDRVTLSCTGSASALSYYTINGQAVEINREIRVTYETLSFDTENDTFNPIEASTILSHAQGHIYVPATLCDTRYILHPDRFASLWESNTQEISTSIVAAVAVDAHTKADQQIRDADNEISTDSQSLGGSAPCEITFSAAVSDAAIFRRWEVSTSPDFENVELIFDSTDFTFTFTDAGNTYVRFLADNASGSCQYTSETYTITIGESRLECPNAFSPGNEDGVNDEWKVSYSSIVTFHCEIFNRWGKRLATLTDPAMGWDGKAGGKTVGSGVYFYVINAVGADGKKYKLSGDINVIGTRSNPSAASGGDEAE